METKKKILELRIPLPAASDGHVPQQRSFRWCGALYKALRPLRKFLLQDGSEALCVDIATRPWFSAELSGSFGQESKRDFEEKHPNFVCRILLLGSYCASGETIWFTLKDFLGDAAGAKEKFARVIRHLDEHAVPQIAPEWIAKALEALKQS